MLTAAAAVIFVCGICAVFIVKADARAPKPKNYSTWIRIGRCEQPGRGYMGINWSHRGPTYQGGLGFYYRTWLGFRDRNMPMNAGDASWRQQMKVANKLYRRYGLSPWGCA